MPTIEQILAQASGINVDILQQQALEADNISFVNSSWVDNVSYNAAIKTLRVELIDGSQYTYYNVPESIYLRMVEPGASPGTVVNRYIKTGFYPFVRG